MRINSLQLKPFAGITDKKVELSPGLNVIIGPNEAGKSTLLNALKSVLFTEVNLTKSKYERLMKEYMPAQGGNTVRVYLRFQVDGKEYWLEKTWKVGGKEGSCLFRFDDEREFTGDSEVSELINQFLPAKEGTIRNILLTWQSELSRTMNVLDAEGRGIRSDLGTILRSSIMETDGISVDILKENLDREYEEYFQHWDIEREEPENGRGINNPYKREVGKILGAYYEKEKIIKSYVEANEIEKEIDELNKVIQEKEAEQIRIREELTEYEPIKSQVLERKQVESDIIIIKHKTKELVEINKIWPIQDNWLSKSAYSKIKEYEGKKKKLEQEMKDARQYLGNKELRKRFEKVQRLHKQIEKANNKLAKITRITREDIENLQMKKHKIKEIESAIMASKLKLSLVSNLKQDFSTRDATGQKEEHSLKKGEKIEKTFQGKLFLEHQDWNLEVQAGEGEIDSFISQKEEKTKKFEDELERIGIESLEKAQSVNKEYEKYKTDAIYAERDFKEELGDDNYEALEKKVENLGEEKLGRSLEDISSDIAHIDRDLRDIQEEKKKVEDKIKQWKGKYGSNDELILKLGENQYQLKELNKKLKDLPMLPDGFEDYKSFFDYLDSLNEDGREYQDEISELRVQKAQKESEKPEQSSEELNVMVGESEQNFQRICLEGKAIAMIRTKAKELLGELGMNTYGEFQNQFKKYFIKMSGNSFSGIKMEDDYPKKLIKPNGSELTYNLLSFGTIDTFSLALRLTMAGYFLKDKEGFLMLDDPLVEMDSGRQALAAEQINEFAKTKQVIFLTCHPQIARMLNGKNIKIFSVE